VPEIKISVTGSSASSQKYDRPSSQAFDGNTTEWAWWASLGGNLTNEWVAGHFDSGQIVNIIRFYASLDPGKNIKHAKLEGSNDGSNWTKIPATGWSEGASQYNGDEILFASSEGWQEVTFDNETSYTRYRLFCYDAYIELSETPVHIVVSELEFYYDDSKPIVTSFAIDEGESSTKDREVTLDNVCTGDPTHYMASEDPDFVLNEIWQGNHNLASAGNKVQDFDAGSSVDWELFSLTLQSSEDIQFRSKSAATEGGLAGASYGAWQDGITGSITAANNRWLRVEIRSTGVVASPVSQWKMNDKLATKNVVDSAGSNDGAADQNTEDISTAGKINDALTFNGSTDIIIVPDSASLDVTNAVSFSFWVYLNAYPAVTARIFSKWQASDLSYLIEIQPTGSVGLAYSTTGSNVLAGAGKGNIPLSTWTHVVIINNGVNSKAYIDNEGGTAGAGGSFYVGGADLEIGASTFEGRYLDGNIDDARLYNFVLTENEISLLYNLGNGTEEENPGINNILTKIVVTYAGTGWLTYATGPSFTLSEGYGEKVVYFKVKNDDGESPVINDSILYLSDYTWLGRGRHSVKAAFTSLGRGKYKLIYVSREWLGRGACRILGIFQHAAKGQYRIADDDLERYELYVGTDDSPDFDSAPLETFTTLPHDTPALDADHTYYFVLRKRNKWDLLSRNIAEWTFVVDADGAAEATVPSEPSSLDIALTPDVDGKVRVAANYYYLEDSEEATQFLIYLTDDGSDPDPDVDTPTAVDMVKVDGIAKLDWLSDAFDDGKTIKIIVRTRRIDAGPVNVDSTNTDISTTTASTSGPDKTEPAGIFFKDIAEQKQGD